MSIRDQPGRPPTGGRRAMSTGTGILLLVVGAVLRFAVAGGSPHGVNVHAVGVILMLAAVLGLFLPSLIRGQLRPDRMRRWVRPGGRGSTRRAAIKMAAAADVADVRQGDSAFDANGPGSQ